MGIMQTAGMRTEAFGWPTSFLVDGTPSTARGSRMEMTIPITVPVTVTVAVTADGTRSTEHGRVLVAVVMSRVGFNRFEFSESAS